MSRTRTLVAAGLIGIALAGLARPIAAQEAAAPAATTAKESLALTRDGDAGLVREVRLALVCYGGSSLAIYIHGNAKELHRLVLASKALQIDALANKSKMQNDMANPATTVKPPPGAAGQKLTGSTRVWYDRLMDLWLNDPKRVRTRVVVDIIAGTSAGGINGVIMAKALAHDLRQDDLTKLWMEKASLRRLTDNYFGFFRIFAGRAPINGDALAGWLYEALDSMDRQAVGRAGNHSLLPKGDQLDLFVTTTDLYGYPQQIVIDNPPLAAEKHFPHVLHFIYSGENNGCTQSSGADNGSLDDFCPEWTPAMAFAARASSSIPGVFPPLNLEETLALFKSLPPSGPPIPGVAPPASPDVVVQRLFRNYQLQEPTRQTTYAKKTYFVDGGVLDNHPFGPAIAQILQRPQDQEVRRVLVYLQPDPGKPPAAPNGQKPSLISTILAGLSGIPGQQPILNEINDIAAYNEKVKQIRDVVHSEEVATQAFENLGEVKGNAACADPASLTVMQRVGCVGNVAPNDLNANLLADQERLRSIGKTVEDTADQGVTEFAGRSYYNLRVHSVLDQFVDVIAGEKVCNYPRESAHRALVARIIERWAERQGLIDDAENPQSTLDLVKQKDLQKEFLKDFDIGYQRRQLRFVTDWINGQYTANPLPSQDARILLDKLKAAATMRINELTQLEAGKSSDPELVEQMAGLYAMFNGLSPWQNGPDGKPQTIDKLASDFVSEKTNRDALEAARLKVGAAIRRMQQGVRDQTFKDFTKLAPHLSSRQQQQILVRYFGFPFWDRQIYPLLAFSDLGELAPIDVVRFSPDDAKLLGEREAIKKLSGASLGHFGAFLSREGRESDYVWGRLDAAERLLDVLKIPLADRGARELFSAIVSEVGSTEGDLIRKSILAERKADIDKYLPH